MPLQMCTCSRAALLLGLWVAQATCFAPTPASLRLMSNAQKLSMCSHLKSIGSVAAGKNFGWGLGRGKSSSGLLATRCTASSTAARGQGERSAISRIVAKVAVLAAAVVMFIPTQTQAKVGSALLEDQAQAGISSGLPSGSQQAQGKVVLVANAATQNANAATQGAVDAVLAFDNYNEDENWPGWERTTRKMLLERARAHQDDHHEQTGLTKIILSPLQTFVDTLKLMIPLLLITVPICWVFPWEMFTGGYKDSIKVFRKNQNEHPKDIQARNTSLWLTTILDFFLAVAGGSGGGGHH